MLFPATLGDIRQTLAAARQPAASWAALADALDWLDIEIALSLPEGAVWPMERFVALRGALGRALRADTATPCRDAGDIPSAAQLMYLDWETKLTPGLDYPKPFLLQMDVGTGTVRVRLFGPLRAHAAEIAAALLRTLGQRHDNPVGAVYPIRSRAIVPRRVVLDGFGAAEAADLHFLTPLAMRRERTKQDAPQAVLRGILRRVSGVLSWYGIGLPDEVIVLHRALAERYSQAVWADGTQGRDWPHASARQSRVFDEFGTSGVLRLNAPLDGLATLFQLGEVVHAGGKATVGGGRYRLVRR